MRRTASGWGEPERLPAPINTDSNELSPAVSADGTVYFASDRPGGLGSLDIYRAMPTTANGGSAYTVENLGPTVNSDAVEYQASPSSDGRTLVFTGAGRPDALVAEGSPYDRGDLYVTRRGPSGWTTPVHLPAPINTTANESAPRIAADGRALFFISERSFVTARTPAPFTYLALRDGFASVLNGLGNVFQSPWPPPAAP